MSMKGTTANQRVVSAGMFFMGRLRVLGVWRSSIVADHIPVLAGTDRSPKLQLDRFRDEAD